MFTFFLRFFSCIINILQELKMFFRYISEDFLTRFFYSHVIKCFMEIFHFETKVNRFISKPEFWCLISAEISQMQTISNHQRITLPLMIIKLIRSVSTSYIYYANQVFMYCFTCLPFNDHFFDFKLGRISLLKFKIYAVV